MNFNTKKTYKWDLHISDIKITCGAALNMQKTFMCNTNMLLLLIPSTCISLSLESRPV